MSARRSGDRPKRSRRAAHKGKPRENIRMDTLLVAVQVDAGAAVPLADRVRGVLVERRCPVAIATGYLVEDGQGKGQRAHFPECPGRFQQGIRVNISLAIHDSI